MVSWYVKCMLQCASCPLWLRLYRTRVVHNTMCVCVFEGWLYCCVACPLRLSRNLIPCWLVAHAEGRRTVEGESRKILNRTVCWQRETSWQWEPRQGQGRAVRSHIFGPTLWHAVWRHVVLLLKQLYLRNHLNDCITLAARQEGADQRGYSGTSFSRPLPTASLFSSVPSSLPTYGQRWAS